MKARLSRLALVACLTSLCACYTFRVETQASKPATEPRRLVVWCYFWQEARISPDNCVTGNLHRVTLRTNFGYTLLTVGTLGLIHPVQIEWTCAPDPPTQPGNSLTPPGTARQSRPVRDDIARPKTANP